MITDFHMLAGMRMESHVGLAQLRFSLRSHNAAKNRKTKQHKRSKPLAEIPADGHNSKTI